jgi:medium-chain acyl-[acyl-carrier-protein] hydrolase
MRYLGHSMGAVLAYELACHLIPSRGQTLCTLFVSGSRAPFLQRRNPPVSQLPDNEFLSHISDLNGTPCEVLANAELMDLVRPVLRADCRMYENYRFQNRCQLKIPITAFAGDNDADISNADTEAWGRLTEGKFRRMNLHGDHFFINENEAAIYRHYCK